MTTISPIEKSLQPRERVFALPNLALRRRSTDHPMAMFALTSGLALMSMAFASTSGTAFAGLGEPATAMDTTRTTEKQNRLPLSPKDIACRGQAWSAESQECLVMIAREAGRGADFKVRKLASAETAGTSIF